MFSFKSLGHFFATVAHDVHGIGSFVQSHQPQINKALETGAVLVSAFDPALASIALQIERASESALGEVLAVVSKVSDAEAAKGLNITLDQAAIQEFKNLLAAIEKVKPGATIAPPHLVPGA